jgi:hypothetical protein
MKYSFKKTPPILDIGFHIDEPKLWARWDIPVEEIDIQDIMYNADIPYLEHEWTNDWNMTPEELIENFENESSHAEKVLQADLQYPIELYFFKWKWIILDGVHRFTKALRLKETTIRIRRISEEIAQKTKRI